MLKRWSIENFKSFRGRTDIPLAPISVFAGANSSGKSTIIQSILLLKQTVQYAPINRAVALNGPLLTLGTFNDVKNATSSASHIGIGWELEVEDLTQMYRALNQTSFWSFPLFFYGESSIASISAEFRWDVEPAARPGSPREPGALLQLQPRLASSSINALRKNEKSTPSNIEITRPTTLDAASYLHNFPFSATRIDGDTLAELTQSKPDPAIVGVAVRLFFRGKSV